MIAQVHSMPRLEDIDSVVEQAADVPTDLQKTRNDALDWVKGALVVLMVVYHSINYSSYPRVAFAYIGFLPVSFIFIAGFLLTNSYLTRYDLREWRLHRRLVLRGAKLLAIYSALNVARYFITFGYEFLNRFLDNSRLIYLGAAGHVASYPILTSIGYLLLCAPLLLVIGSLNRWVLPVLAAALVAFCTFMEWRASVGYHLGMISAGIVGTAFGFLPLRRITEFAKKLLIIVTLYCLYRTARYFIGEPYALQLIGVVTTLLLLYGVALKLPVSADIFKQVALLGKYSLLGYIVQLAIIQATARAFGPFATPLSIVTLTLVALAATWAIIFLVHRLRATASLIDTTYRFVFA